MALSFVSIRAEILPSEPDDLAACLPGWFESLKPENDHEEWLVTLAATASVKLKRCVLREAALDGYERRRATLSWDHDRRLDAENLAASLAKDPARTIKRLAQTKQGAQWLLERWTALATIAQAGRPWSDPQRSLALDLLGLPPHLRDAVSPPQDPENQAAMALEHAENLQSQIDLRLTPQDADAQALAASPISISFSPTMTRLRRHEALWSRTFHLAIADLRHLRRSQPASLSPPTPKPFIPRPEPDYVPPDDLSPDSPNSPFEAEMAAFQLELQAKPLLQPSLLPSPTPTPTSPPHNRRARRARLAHLRSSN